GKRLMHEIREGSRLGRIGPPFETNHRGIDFWTGLECAGRDSETVFDCRVVLNQYRERPVLLCPRLSGETLRDFFLDHDGDAEDPIAIFDESLKEERRHVVWQIADDVERAAG